MSEPRPTAFLTDFRDPAGCFGRVAGWLHAGMQSPAHPFHTMAVATAGEDGTADARTVVLRGFDPDGRELRFHTDRRAPKVAALRADPRLTLLFYDPGVRLQVRVPAVATVHHEDGTAAAAWGSSAESSRAPYALADKPGTELRADDPVPNPAPPAVDDAVAFGRFVLVTCKFETMEVLELGSAGHRRAAFVWDGDEVRLTRLAP
jgi:pyridoxamine 5'-phosphate oxidase